MITFKSFVEHNLYNLLSTIVLVLLYSAFLFNHIISIRNGEISKMAIIFVAMETLVIYLIVSRKNPVVRSHSSAHTFAAIAATFLPLLFIPSGKVLYADLGNILMLIGGILALLAYLSLNKSFGVTPAIREIKVNGLYKFIRHPMYLSYLFIYIGYINLSFSIINICIFILFILLLILRIRFEEEILQRNTDYKAYSALVKYRLFPYIF